MNRISLGCCNAEDGFHTDLKMIPKFETVQHLASGKNLETRPEYVKLPTNRVYKNNYSKKNFQHPRRCCLAPGVVPATISCRLSPYTYNLLEFQFHKAPTKFGITFRNISPARTSQINFSMVFFSSRLGSEKKVCIGHRRIQKILIYSSRRNQISNWKNKPRHGYVVALQLQEPR